MENWLTKIREKYAAFKLRFGSAGVWVVGGVVILLLLFTCSCSKQEVGFDTLETARTQAKENGEKNAKIFRQQEPSAVGRDIRSRGDSTQKADCPQGDGWVSVDFINPQNSGDVIKAKCSTTSLALGCMTDADFKSKSYAEEDGQCASLNRVPFPIRKLTE